MISVPKSVNFSAMPKKAESKNLQSVRVRGELLNRARSFIKRQPVPPSLTAVFETALERFLDEQEKPAKPSKAKMPD